MRRFLACWLPAVAWTAVVLFASGGEFSRDRTGEVLAAMIAAFFGPVDPLYVEIAHIGARKGAHLTEYAILSLLWFRAWRAGGGGGWPRWAGLALLVCLATAVADETRQSFLVTRGGSAADVLLDMTGAFAIQFVLWKLLTMRRAAPVAPET